MTFYTRHQLALLLALLAAGAVGLGVRQWRAAYPALAERLEQLDREPEAGEAARAPAAERPRPPAPKAVTPATGVDVNHATADDLAQLPGIGPALAARIVESRQAGGAFASIDDLSRVKGVGRVRLERLRAVLTVGD